MPDRSAPVPVGGVYAAPLALEEFERETARARALDRRVRAQYLVAAAYAVF